MPLLTLDGIGVRLGGRQVLSDVTFSLDTPEVTAASAVIDWAGARCA